MRPWLLGVIVLLLLLTPKPSIGKETADLILCNGKIITVDRDFSIAQAVAVKDGLIMAVGKNGQIRKLTGPKTTKIDLKGKTVIPGLMDAHAHMDREGLKYVCIKDIEVLMTMVGGKIVYEKK
jgi:predicted amidohydrolase YtcJ